MACARALGRISGLTLYLKKKMTTKEERAAARRQLLAERNDAIRADFEAQWKQGYRMDYIIEHLRGKYFLNEKTLNRIVFRRDAYEEY